MQKRANRKSRAEIDLLDDMLIALVDLLEEKELLTHEEWEKRLRKR